MQVDDPVEVAAEVAARSGGRVVPAADLAAWAAEAQELRALADAVLAAEEVVEGARAHARARRATAIAAGPEAGSGPEANGRAGPEAGSGPEAEEPDGPQPGSRSTAEDPDGPDADRAAVRFALVVLALAQVGGVAVHAADDMILAAVVPAVAIAGVLAVAYAHRPARAELPPGRRRPDADEASAGAAPAGRSPGGAEPGGRPHPPEPGPDGAPEWAAGIPAPLEVRSAEAHLRRQQAAWKLAWWERGLRPPDVTGWVGPGRPGDPVATLVVSDPTGVADRDLVAAVTVSVPATVRVVLVRGRRPGAGTG